MRNRILAAIVGTVVLALLLAGVGTYVLLAGRADRQAESNLRAEAESLASLIDVSRNQQTGALNQQRITDGLRLEGIGVVRVRPTGELVGTPPDGVGTDQLDQEALLAGETLSGRRRGLVWAASPVATRTGGAFVVVVTRSADRPRPPVGWFLLGGGIALAVAAAVAGALSANLIRPLRQADLATRRIAAGDLTARLPEPPAGADDELADLTRSINTMAAALEHSRGLERQFLLSVSHDLRTPLTSIRGYAEAIVDGTAPVAADAARVIGQEANRLGRLVADLLDLARLDADGFRFVAQDVPVGEVADEAAEGFRPSAEAAGIRLTVIDPTRIGSARRWPTSWRTGSSSPRRRSPSRPPSRRAAERRSPSPTTGRASPRRISARSSTGSTWPTAARPAVRAAAGSAWPSSGSSWWPWAAPSTPSPRPGPTAPEPASSSASPRPLRPEATADRTPMQPDPGPRGRAVPVVGRAVGRPGAAGRLHP